MKKKKEKKEEVEIKLSRKQIKSAKIKNKK
jgi:hypothetical protein